MGELVVKVRLVTSTYLRCPECGFAEKLDIPLDY